MQKEYTVFDIADWFLAKEPMSHKKLQKLCFYFEAWSNALFDRSFTNNTEYQAWAHGPVNKELFEKYTGNGWNDIVAEKESDITDEQAVGLLESVWITYGDKSANELEALTHLETPWKVARLRAGVSEGQRSNEPIAPEDMKNYYKSIYIGD
ncbi:Panacea domain-containing protein [Vagococcus fluvialis]|uniref:Panacea domain-containing protein n=1 Tax=Vagococcus fluvialis TaxID=2738 RepID=UPI003B599181